MITFDHTQPEKLDPQAFAEFGAEDLVYARPVGGQELLEELPESRSEIDVSNVYYAVYSASGARLAVAQNHQAAIAIAQANDVELVSVH